MTARRTVGRLTVAVTAGAITALVGLSGAAAQTGTAADTAFVRTAHLSPDTPKVDVYLTAFRGGSTKLVTTGVGYGDVSGYHRMPAGQYAVAMRPAGAPASSPAALSWTVTMHSGDSYTAAAIGEQAHLRGIVLSDTVKTPHAGSAVVRVVQASDNAHTVAVHLGGTTVSPGIAFGSVTGYLGVPAGPVTVSGASTTDPAVHGSAVLRFASRTAVTVLLLDEKGGGMTMRTIVDAAGPGRAPAGAVDAGGGGTARHVVTGGVSVGDPTGPIVLVAVTTGVALVAAGVVTRRRRRATA